MAKLLNSLMAPETSSQASSGSLTTWRVKLSNGAVYGPINLGELRSWAEECRLAPGDQVSSDTVHWVNAESLPELAMQWMVEMTSGEIFGPVHLHAVVDLFLARLVNPNSRLTNSVTGEVSTVADLVLPLTSNAAKDEFPAGAPAVAESATSDDRLIRFTQDTAAASLPPDQDQEKLQLRIAELQAMLAESQAYIQQLQRDLDSQQTQTLKLRDETAALEKTYLLKLADLQENGDVAANLIKKLETQVQALGAELAQKEQQGADAERDWESFRSEKESRIQALTRQIEVTTADQAAMHAALEQNRAKFEQARQETQKLASRAKQLNERISGLNSQVQNVSENLAESAAEVAEERGRIEPKTGEHLQPEAQLQTKIEGLSARLNALSPELQTVRGELAGREAAIERMAQRMSSMEKSGPASANEAQQKIRRQGLPEQPLQIEVQSKRREMLPVTEKAKLTRGDPGRAERKSAITSVPDRQKMSHKAERNILVVDDSVVMQQLITKLAEKFGASVTAVASARDVREILAEKTCRFDLFILDLILPEITGWEILETLKARPQTKDTPIIVFTGPLSAEEQEKILRKADAVIEKSKFTLADFNKVLNKWL